MPYHSSYGDTVKEYAGINDRDFFTYFEGKSRAFAIEIQNLLELPDPIDPYETMPGFVPPQSYCYMDGVAGSVVKFPLVCSF